MPKKRRARRAVLAGAAAAGVSGALVLGTTTDFTAHDAVTLANTIINVGGRGDPTSERVAEKLSGDYALGFPDAGNPVLVGYPATVSFQSSVNAGVPVLKQDVSDARTADPDGKIRVVSYSEGTMVAEQVKRDYANAGYTQSPKTVDFVFIASPNVPNGGIFGRFPGFQIPGLLPAFSAAQPTEYNSTYVTNEYDGFADFPAYFNPLSIANALAGMAYAHPDQYYNDIDLANLQEGQGKFTTEKDNTAGGHDTYVLVYNPHLPLFAPIRQIATLTHLTPLTEPVLGAVEPLVRLMVDMGYTDRTNANPATPTAFSFITPPSKVVEALTGVPGAVKQGAANATSGGQTAITPAAVPTPAANRSQQTQPAVQGLVGSPNQDPPAAGPPSQDPPATVVDAKTDPPKQPVAQLPVKPPKKVDVNPFKALAKAISEFGQPTGGNKVVPTTVAGTTTTPGQSTLGTTINPTPADHGPSPSSGAPASNASASGHDAAA